MILLAMLTIPVRSTGQRFSMACLRVREIDHDARRALGREAKRFPLNYGAPPLARSWLFVLGLS